ncbi:MAG: hypothetical protein AAB074_17460 [Planctomycetota bacterium]
MSRTFGAVFLLACALPSFADNLATEWMDRVTHEVQQQEGPLSTRPVDFHLYGGVYGYYTDNLFLANNRDADGDSAVIGLARARIDYVDSQLEISADAMVNFDYYMEHHEGREDEERFFGKIRWTDGVVDLQLVEIARRESDPIDAVFADRVRRVVTDTFPRAGVRFAELFKLEAFAQIETVWFEHDDFDGRENESVRGGVAFLGDITPTIAIGAEAGLYGIHYRDEDTTNSAEGAFVRALMRGEPLSKLLIEVAAGWGGIRSDDPDDPDDRKRTRSTFDAELHVRWEATSTITIFFDYTRRYGFAGFGDPYQHIDRGVVIAEWQVFEKLKLRGRGQYDYVHPSQSQARTFWAGTLSASFQVFENMTVEGGVIYRGGNQRGVSGDNYDNWIFYLGVVFGF